ncbi:winged helix-turn-helix transcriptional regulator [Candidatus Pacearchaeota archaeon]|jgi:DNA-binding transcriptional ArsR family regulator|nr:winged helix-turn-helix transcriptional regulator [Candidatus Pacearchaeota archaeon]
MNSVLMTNNFSTYHVFFRNLANPLKIRIISALKEKESSVNDLAYELNVEQSKISHALALLKKCNIVKYKKKGKERIYSLNKKTIIPLLKLIDEHSKSFCNCKSCKGCEK